ncbi:MAG: signal recognition particle-docking protein FtsY [Candidatus Poribacteria bacterium]|nr:signal recognition particle-docking protein FtsY [Candidatus Poribacteria bacterium]
MLRNLFKKKDKVKDQESSAPLETIDLDVAEGKLDSSVNGTEEEKRKSWFNRLKTGLSKTQENLVGHIRSLLRADRKIDEELMEEIEEILIQADVGVNTTMMLMDNVRDIVQSEGLSNSSDLEGVIQQEILNILDEIDQPLDISDHQPYTILVLGVNGAGKTTTIGKLAHRFKSEDNHVLVAAADTFRAAATDQLQVWCDRAGVELIKGSEGSDPASVVFDAVDAGKSRGADVVIVDTAGRLHTKKPLMDELAKIGRIMERAIPGAPHEVLLVIDGTAGQNAIIQAKIFHEAVPVTGVAITKLDGTAKGGIVIAVKHEIGAPVKLIGIGEQLDDLRDFVAKDFTDALFQQESHLESNLMVDE